MKAIAIEACGGAEQLKLLQLPVPEPQDREVLVEIACAGVNPVDWKIREGFLRDLFPHGYPLIPGWDAAGTVCALGRDAAGFGSGDRVCAYCRKPKIQWGAYAEYIALAADVVAPIPSNLSFAQAAAIPLTALTAWQALFDFAQLGRGQSVLIHAGAGGVGGMAIQFAHRAGATVYTTASARNHAYALGLGAHYALDYPNVDFAAAIGRGVPTGLDVVLDTVGGAVQARSYAVLKPGGVLVSIVDAPDQTVAARHRVRAGFVFVTPDGGQLRNIMRLIEAGEILPPRIEELPLEEAATAQERSRSGHVCGKLVLRVH